MNDDQLLLANAYVDDDLTGDERARAETDPEVMGQVVRLRAVRQALRAMPAPDPNRRERAIAAALAEGVPGPSTAVAGRPAALPRRSPNVWRGIGAAAALVAVIAAGAVLVRSGGSDGDDAQSSATALDEAAPFEASERATTSSSESPLAVTGGAATSAAAAPGAGEASADTSAVAPAGDGSQAAPTPADDTALLPTLDSPDALAAFAAEAGSAPAEATSEAASACGGGRFVGHATYTAGGGAGTVVDVFVEAGEAVARDVTTCAIVERAALP